MHGKFDRLWMVLYAAWLSAILWLSLDPSPPSVDLGPLGWDKFQHAAAYALLTLFGGLSLQRFLRPSLAWVAAWGIAVLYGAMMEIGQGMLTSHRSADWLDVLANAFGAAAAVLLGRRVCRRIANARTERR